MLISSARGRAAPDNIQQAGGIAQRRHRLMAALQRLRDGDRGEGLRPWRRVLQLGEPYHQVTPIPAGVPQTVAAGYLCRSKIEFRP